MGSWQTTERIQPDRFKIDDNGNISFALNSFGVNFLYYTGKIAYTFDYPYIVEVSATIKSSEGKTETKNGKFTFESASKCQVSVPHFIAGAKWTSWDVYDKNFIK